MLHCVHGQILAVRVNLVSETVGDTNRVDLRVGECGEIHLLWRSKKV